MYRTPEQATFLQYVEELRKRGSKDKDIAEMCKLTRAAVSMIVNGHRSPSAAALELLRQAVAGDVSTQTQPTSQPTSEIHEKLNDLRECDPDGYQTVTGLIQTLHKHVKKPKAASSSKPSLRELATGAHPLRAEVREPIPKADEPNESKPLPHTPASPRPKVRQVAPTRAPSSPVSSTKS